LRSSLYHYFPALTLLEPFSQIRELPQVVDDTLRLNGQRDTIEALSRHVSHELADWVGDVAAIAFLITDPASERRMAALSNSGGKDVRL
jgi:hypothetical protein